MKSTGLVLLALIQASYGEDLLGITDKGYLISGYPWPAMSAKRVRYNLTNTHEVNITFEYIRDPEGRTLMIDNITEMPLEEVSDKLVRRELAKKCEGLSKFDESKHHFTLFRLGQWYLFVKGDTSSKRTNAAKTLWANWPGNQK